MRNIIFILFFSLVFLPARVLGLSVSSTTPTSNASGVSLDSNITAYFDVTLDSDVATINFDNEIELYRITDNSGEDLLAPIRLTGQGSISGSILTFNPNLDFSAGSKHRVVLTTNIKGADSSSLSSSHEWFFTTIYENTEENTVVGTDNITKVVLPANSLPADGYVLINLSPAASPTLVSLTDISDAETAALSAGDPYRYPIDSTMKEFAVYQGASTLYADGDLNANVTVYLPFTDSNNDRFVDGTSPPVLVDYLEVYYMNTTTKRWVKVSASHVDAVNGLVTASVSKLSIFVLMGHVAPGLKDAYAFPVPYTPNDNPNHTSITFTKLIPFAKIKIFTLTAKLVRELETDYLGSDITWDGTNNHGQKLASGVYIYRIWFGGDSKTGKIVIVR